MEKNNPVMLQSTEELRSRYQSIISNSLVQTKHGWNQKDSPGHFSVTGNVIKYMDANKISGAIRGSIEYQMGIHYFQLQWKPEKQMRTVIGIATSKANLHEGSDQKILGADTQSVGLDLVSREVFHGGCKVCKYPAEAPDSYKLPGIVLMILNMDKGSLSFKVTGRNIEVVITNLKKYGAFHIAAELEHPGNTIAVKYIGTRDCPHKNGTYEELPTLMPTRQSRGQQSGSLVVSQDVTITCDRYGNMTNISPGPPVLSSCSRIDDERLTDLVHSMKTKTAASISKVNEQLKQVLGSNNKTFQDRGAEKLISIDAAKIITEYLKYLDTNKTEDALVAENSVLLLQLCVFYSNHLLLMRAFVDGGLLDYLICKLQEHKEVTERASMSKECLESVFQILRSSVKLPDVQSKLQQGPLSKLLTPYCVTEGKQHDLKLEAICVNSYVSDTDEFKEILVSESIVHEILSIVVIALESEDSSYAGWNIKDMANMICKLSSNSINAELFYKSGVLEHLIKMIDRKDKSEQESGLNAIFSLTTNEEKAAVVANTTGFSFKLEELTESDDCNVKQTACKLKMKLGTHWKGSDILVTQRIDKSSDSCEYRKLCTRFKETLNLSDCYFDLTYDVCFCPTCQRKHGGQLKKYKRGQPPKEYGVPDGWCRFGLELPAKARALKALEKWHRCYHGTKKDHVKGILEVAEILPAGKSAMGGKKIREQTGHYNDYAKPPGFNTKQVFLSPSAMYAGHECFARSSRYTDWVTGKDYAAQVAFKVLIRPGCYKISEGTVGTPWQNDPRFDFSELEWSTDQHGCTILYGLMVKLDDHRHAALTHAKFSGGVNVDY